MTQLDWQDQGTLLSARPYGETSVLAEVFTLHHGRHVGIVRGGVSRKLAAALQPGSHLSLRWQARLEDQLGTFTVEPMASRAGALSDRLALAGLASVCAMLSVTLPERAPLPDLYARTEPLFNVIGRPFDGWPLDYLRWEARLLDDLGVGLDLTRCAVTGSRDDLVFVSPRTGRAVSRQGAGDWASKLLPLPPCLLGQGGAHWGDIAAGLRLTGYFLDRFLQDHGRPVPEARNRLISAIERQL